MDKGLSKAQENLPGFENLSLRQKYLLGQCFEKLSRRGQNDLIDCVSSLIAAANEVSPATGNKMNKFLSSELAASGPVKKATHGFSIENAADGRIAIQFSKIQGDGTTVTYQFCSGVVGLSRGDLRIYGNEKLHGAELGLYSEFEDIVKQELLPAVKGLTVERKELQTEDDALQLLCDVVFKGVRTKDMNTFVSFHREATESASVVSDLVVQPNGEFWRPHSWLNNWGFFKLSPSPESKK